MQVWLVEVRIDGDDGREVVAVYGHMPTKAEFAKAVNDYAKPEDAEAVHYWDGALRICWGASEAWVYKSGEDVVP